MPASIYSTRRIATDYRFSVAFVYYFDIIYLLPHKSICWITFFKAQSPCDRGFCVYPQFLYC